MRIRGRAVTAAIAGVAAAIGSLACSSGSGSQPSEPPEQVVTPCLGPTGGIRLATTYGSPEDAVEAAAATLTGAPLDGYEEVGDEGGDRRTFVHHRADGQLDLVVHVEAAGDGWRATSATRC